MGISSKLMWTLGGVLLVSSAFAGQKDGDYSAPTPSFGKPSMGEVSRRLENVEKKLDQISEEKVSDHLGAKNPATITSYGETGFFTDVSFLYWQAINRGWVPAFDRKAPATTPAGNTFNRSRATELDFDWSPGLRLGLGYNSKYDFWSVEALWTWIRFSENTSFTGKDWVSGSSFGLAPNLDFLPIAGFYKTLRAHWRLNHNVGDLQFARGFYITKAITLQPLLGARVATLNQTINAHFGENALFPAASQPLYAALHATNEYWGIGPRIGVDSKWTLPHNIGFTGLITGSLLYGKLEIERHTYATPNAALAPLEETGFRDNSFYTVMPTVQLALGLDWGMRLNKDRMYWGLSLAWEFNYWWNQAHFDDFETVQFPVEMQGITLKTDFHF